MAFVAKYGLGGDLTWLEETQADTSFGFAAEVELGSDEDVYVSGYDPGPNYEYISRFTENGNILWTRYQKERRFIQISSPVHPAFIRVS